MAENEGNSGATRTITAAENPPVPLSSGEDVAAGIPDSSDQPGGEPASSGGSQTLRTEPAVCQAQLAGVLESCPVQQGTMVGTEFTDLSTTTTIIYVQPDGTLLESGSGLTAEEQQAVLNQLSKHQIVQVSDTQAAQLLQQTQVVETIPVQKAVLDPGQLQQVIDQVTKSQNQIQIQTPQQNLNHNNASHQLKTVAQHVTMQYGSVQSEPVKIQIEVPKAEGGVAPQQKSVAVGHPQVKLSAAGTLSNAQIFHIQPVVNQGQQILLQQNPEDPPIQLLLQSPAPVVGSLLPLVHKLTTQPALTGVVSSPAPKPAAFSVRAPTISAVKAPNNKTPLTPSSKTITIPVISLPCNGTDTKSPGKPAAAAVQPAVVSADSLVKVTTLSVVRERDKDKEKERRMKKKKEKKGVKVQTRSGRVSRPPKYKAKDYKFIKTEDLAESHQSDSDDYSDMSEEEEQGEKARRDEAGSSSSLSYSHKSRCHQCQTCDKSYIGPGGLNRHYKLNPTHGEPSLSVSTPTPPRDEDRLDQTDTAREEEEEKPPAAATNTVSLQAECVPAASGLRGFRNRGPGRPRGRGRRRGGGRGQFLGTVAAGFASRSVHRGRYPRSCGIPLTADQQVKRRRERLQELVEQCEVEELTDVVLPHLTEVLSLWELLLAKVDCGGPTYTSFPEIYREFESLQAHVRQAAQEYISSPQSGDKPVEVRNIEVARSLGILDEVNKMKVVPGASPASSGTNKNTRYMENSKMLPPSKRFKMENSITEDQRGSLPQTAGGTPAVTHLKPCSVSVSPLVISEGSTLQTSSSDSTSSSSAQADSSQAPPPDAPMEVQEEGSMNLDQNANAAGQVTEPHGSLGSSSENPSKTAESSLDQTAESPQPQQGAESQTTESPQPQQGAESSAASPEPKELQEGQEIYIQTEQLTVQLAEPGSDGIVIVNGPDGTTMHIQAPEGVPLEAVQALLGIEASDGDKASQ